MDPETNSVAIEDSDDLLLDFKEVTLHLHFHVI